MVQRLPETYQVDPLDPRAPSQEIWDRMSPEERDRVVAMLPIEGMAKIPEVEELVVKLGAMLAQELINMQDAEERATAEAARADAEAARAETLQQKLAEAEALIAKLQRGE